MSIFSLPEEHDMGFEHRLMREKFTVVAGEFDCKWQVIELKPKFDYQKDYPDCKIYPMCYLSHHLVWHYKPFWFKGFLTNTDWVDLEKELRKIVKKRKIQELVFPTKTLDKENEYIPTTMYVVPKKEMDILGEKICSWISRRYPQIDSTKDS